MSLITHLTSHFSPLTAPNSQLDGPAFAVVRLDESVGIRNICDVHVLPVKIQFLARTDGDVAHEGEFGEGAGVVEVGARSTFAPAGIKPVAVVSLDAAQRLGRSLVGLHLGLGDDAGGFRPTTAQYGAFGADEEDTVVAEASTFFQLCRTWRHQSAFVPGDAYGSHIGASREMEVDERCSRTGLIGGAVRAGLDTEGGALVQFQHPEGWVQMVAGKVADRAGAKLPPGAPADRSVIGMIRAARHGLQPALPIEAGGHRRRFFRSVGEAGPAASTRVGPSMHVVDITDRTVPDPLAGKADVLTGVSEVAELCSDPGLAGGFGDNAGLVDSAAEGLFTV